MGYKCFGRMLPRHWKLGLSYRIYIELCPANVPVVH